MTDFKQKAKESAEQHGYGLGCTIPPTECYEAGYIAGAAENGIQWHNLQENPNDLPKKNKSYWVYIECQGNKIYRSIVWRGHWLWLGLCSNCLVRRATV